MRIQIDGPPIPYSRPRVTRRGTYNPRYSEKKNVKNLLLFYGFKKLNKPIRVNLIFSLSIPKSTSKRKRSLMLENSMNPIKKPDLDNLVKFILDCASGILFEDDKLIVQLSASKRYAEEPSTILHIESLRDEEEVKI